MVGWVLFFLPQVNQYVRVKVADVNNREAFYMKIPIGYRQELYLEK